MVEEELLKEVIVAVPACARTARKEEEVVVLEAGKRLAAVGPKRPIRQQMIAQGGTEALQGRGGGQKFSDLGKAWAARTSAIR